MYDTFTAIDFETANRYRNSACAIGLVKVRRGRVVRRLHRLIRPPFRRFEFSHLHGIHWDHVRDEPCFDELLPELGEFFDVDYLVAHNAAFDASVLSSTCGWYGIEQPNLDFVCTLAIARQWGLRPARLPDVARHLGILLWHHDAASDAEVCARIMLASLRSQAA